MRLGGGAEAGTQLRGANQSVRSVGKKFHLHFQLSGSLRALHCKFQMYEDRCRRETSS